MTNNAGVEFFERLDRARQGPRPVLATYVVVLGLGFFGRFGLPGADQYTLAQLRRDLAIQLGVDEDRDWTAGVLRPSRKEAADAAAKPRPFWESLWVGRSLAVALLVTAVCVLATVLAGNLR
jgi:type VI secretion system protein ImpK